MKLQKTFALVMMIGLILFGIMGIAIAEEATAAEVFEAAAEVIAAETEAPASESIQGTPVVAQEAQPVATANPTKAPAIYMIKFLDKNGREVYRMQVEEGAPILYPTISVQEIDGFRFECWIITSTNSAFVFGTTAAGDVTLQAYYQVIEEKVNYEENVANVEKLDNLENNVGELLETEEVNVTAEESIKEGSPDAEVQENGRSVSMAVVGGTNLMAGDSVTLLGLLSGFDGMDVTFQWQYLADGEWVDISGAIGQAHTFTLDTENAFYSYRLVVSTDA